MEYLDLHKEINSTTNRLERRGNEELIFNGYGVSIWKDEKALEMDGGNDCRIM